MRFPIRPGAVICLFIFATAELQGAESADPNISSRASSSAAPARSLAMLEQVVTQLGHFTQNKDLSAIHNEDIILDAAAKALFAQADTMAPRQGVEFRTDLTAFCSRVSVLHRLADLNQQTESEIELAEVLKSFAKVKAHFPPRIIAEARGYLETYSCPMHRDVVGKSTDFCPKCGMPLDQVARILPSNAGFPMPGDLTVQASVSIATPLRVGHPVAALLHLQKANGEPLLFSDLIETHTRKIHLFLIDRSLTDYHHEHPVPTQNPGEYSFSFTPGQPGGYRVWADLRPYPLGLEEYAMTDIPATTAGKPLTDRAVAFKSSVNGLNYELFVAQNALQVGRPALLRLRITNASGKGFTQLEPILAAFAHLVGFNADGKTVMHIHPKGPPVLDSAARGGPELEFQVYPLRPGFVRLFAQVQIAGRSQVAPFGIEIAP